MSSNVLPTLSELSPKLLPHYDSPKIYDEMADKRQYKTAISIVLCFVLSVYTVITAVGYYYFGDLTKIPGSFLIAYGM